MSDKTAPEAQAPNLSAQPPSYDPYVFGQKASTPELTTFEVPPSYQYSAYQENIQQQRYSPRAQSRWALFERDPYSEEATMAFIMFSISIVVYFL
jgi:hypothetical protein